jgi:hypothetical protein
MTTGIAAIIAISAGILAGILAGLVGYRVQRIARKKRKEEARLQEIFSEKTIVLWDSYYKKLKPSLKQESKSVSKTYLEFLLSNYEKVWRNWLVHYTGYPLTYLPTTEIETEANKKFEELKKRIEGIEKRFPKEATLEKIASVNDAILATKVEALSDAINRIEKKLLTKWDVVKIVFEILAALGVLVGIGFAIANYVAGS